MVYPWGDPWHSWEHIQIEEPDMSWLNNILARRLAPRQQPIVIELDGTSLPDDVYETCDTSTLEDMLEEALGEHGHSDGTEHGPGVSSLFLYGPDTERMLAAIRPVIMTYPLAAGARILVGDERREVRY